MNKSIHYLGLDVHKETIAVAGVDPAEACGPGADRSARCRATGPEAKLKRQKLHRLQTMAASLNYQLVPQPGIPLT